MYYDPDDERVVAKDWREYLSQAKEIGKLLQWMWRELATTEVRRRSKHLVIALIFMTAFQIAEPRTLAAILDGTMKQNWHLFLFGFIGLMVCLIGRRNANYAYEIAREWILGLANGTLDERITELFFEKSLGQHVDQDIRLNHEGIGTGRERTLNLIGIMFFDAIHAFAGLIFSYVFLWFISPVAGAIMTLVILIYAVWMLYLNQKVFEVCIPLDKEFRRLKRYRVERWKNIERVKTSGKERAELDHMTPWFDRLIEKDGTFWRWFIKHANFRDISGTIGFLVIVGYGAHLVWTRQWFGGLFYPLISWSAQVIENMWRVGHIERQFNYNMPSIRSMIDALAIPPDVVTKPNSVVLQKDEPLTVLFDNITHAYPTGEDVEDEEDAPPPTTYVLKNVNFSVGPGEVVAIIGPSGAGKSTLMKLLLRFMDPQGGCVRVNGHDLRDINLASWLSKLSYIPQLSQILDGTIRYNLKYGLTPEVAAVWTDERLWELMRDLCINFSGRLNKGLDTVVGERGVKLSGGQAQRLMIGAAAIKRSPLMIIDEATSSLDSHTEHLVKIGLRKVLQNGIGAVIIAHRLSTVKDLGDRFVVLRDPNEIENGDSQVEAIATTFPELYRISPTFRRLADAQDLVIA